MADGEPETDVPGAEDTSYLSPSSSTQPERSSEDAVAAGRVPLDDVKNWGPTSELATSSALLLMLPSTTSTVSEVTTVVNPESLSKNAPANTQVESEITEADADLEGPGSHEALQSVDIGSAGETAPNTSKSSKPKQTEQQDTSEPPEISATESSQPAVHNVTTTNEIIMINPESDGEITPDNTQAEVEGASLEHQSVDIGPAGETAEQTQVGTSEPPTSSTTESSQPGLYDTTTQVSDTTVVDPESDSEIIPVNSPEAEVDGGSHEQQALDVDPLLKEIVQEQILSIDKSIRSISTVDQVDLVKLLHYAAHSGHMELLQVLLEDPRIEVNKEYLGCTAIIRACWKGHTKVVRLLLLNGADVLICARDGITCLHIAAFCGHIEVVNLLLHGKSHRECWDEADPSLPILSSKRCWALIDRKTCKEMLTALHMVASARNHDQAVAIAVSILEAFRTAVLDFYGLRPNPKVAYDIQTNVWLNFLFRVRRELHIHNPGETSELVLLKSLAACRNDRFGMAIHEELGDYKYEGLVRAYVDLISFSNAKDKMGRTALHQAAWEGKDTLVKLLMWESQTDNDPLESQLGSVANINVADVDGYTPLHLASRKGHRNVVQELLGTKTSVEDNREVKSKSVEGLFTEENYIQPSRTANPSGRSREILMAILKSKDIEKLRTIRQHDVVDRRSILLLPRPEMENSIWLEDRAGITPLHYAVESTHADVVGLLIMHPKTEVFQQASNGQSPWSIAFPVILNNPHAPLTETQLSLKGDVNAQFWSRHQAGGEGFRKMHQEKLLRQARALAIEAEYDLDARDNLQALEKEILFSFRGALAKNEIYRPFLNQHYDLSDCKLNLLHVAAYHGCAQELEALLKLKAYKKLVNEHESFTMVFQTPLHFAIDSCPKSPDAVAVLLKEDTLDLKKKYGNSVGRQTFRMTQEERESATRLMLLDAVEKQFNWNSLGLDQEMRLRLQANTAKMWSIEEHYRDRQVYVDSANAILVGAALIASVAFGGFLQPPLGYVLYYTEFFPDPAPPSTPENFAAVAQHKMVLVFWVFNSLSFFFAIATVLAGAGAVLPSSESINREVVLVRKWLKVTAALLAVSIVCVLGAFTAAASASLPDIAKYQFNFVWSAAIGLGVCLITLCGFGYRLISSIKRKTSPRFVLRFVGTVVVFEASIILYFLCRPLLHRIANDRVKLDP